MLSPHSILSHGGSDGRGLLNINDNNNNNDDFYSYPNPIKHGASREC